MTKPSFSHWISKWCFASREQNLKRGQIEFGSKLRAHKFEWLPSLLKCVFSNLLKVHEDFKGKIVKPSIVSFLLLLNTSWIENHILNIRLWCILSSPGLSIFHFSIVSPNFHLAKFLCSFLYLDIELNIPGHFVLEINLPSIIKEETRSGSDKYLYKKTIYNQ